MSVWLQINKEKLSRKSALSLFWFYIELVSNPFQPNQTCVKREQGFSQAVVNAVD